METLIGPTEIRFIIGLILSIALGYVMGAERESRGKDAGISTHISVLAGSMLFTMLSDIADPFSSSRIAAQIVTGIGFLGAGLIIRNQGSVKNLTTAASIWFAAAVGMAIGYEYYVIAVCAGLLAALVPRIPHIRGKHPSHPDGE